MTFENQGVVARVEPLEGQGHMRVLDIFKLLKKNILK